MTGFFLQILWGTTTTLKVALLACAFGLSLGLCTSVLELMQIKWLYRTINAVLFVVRGLPELFVLFFLVLWFHRFFKPLVSSLRRREPIDCERACAWIDLVAYAAQTFKGAFLAVASGQLEAAKAMGLSSLQIFMRIHLPQAWHHALPGLGNLWLGIIERHGHCHINRFVRYHEPGKTRSQHDATTFYLLFLRRFNLFIHYLCVATAIC